MDTDTALVRIGIPGIALALAALFVAATWRTGDGLAPASRSGWRRRRPPRCRAGWAASICGRRPW
jgi:hypothetical protein